MKLISLKGQNFMKLKAVDIVFDSSGTFRMIGKNGAGKTAVLKLIRMILSGKREMPTMPVRVGEQVALGELTLGDESKTIIAKVTVTPDGGYQLVCTNKDGSVYRKPQTLLNDLIGSISFNPAKLMDMDNKSLRELLFKMADLDLSDIDAEIKRLEDERQSVGRDVSGRQKQIDSLVKYDAPDEEISLSALAEEIKQAHDHNMEVERAQSEINGIRDKIQECDNNIEDAKAQIAKWQTYLEQVSGQKAQHEKSVAEKAKNMPVMIDTSVLSAKMQTAEETNAKIRHNKTRQALVEAFEKDHQAFAALTQQIKDLKAQKSQRLSEATFPVDGLEFKDDEIYYEGLPLDQDSGSGKLLRCTKICAAMNPTLRAVIIDDAEKILAPNMQALHNWAVENDYLILTAAAGDDDETCSVVIEDGVSIQKNREHDDQLGATNE